MDKQSVKLVEDIVADTWGDYPRDLHTEGAELEYNARINESAAEGSDILNSFLSLSRTCEKTARVWRWVEDRDSYFDHNVYSGLNLLPSGAWSVIDYVRPDGKGFDAFLPSAYLFSSHAKAQAFLDQYRYPMDRLAEESVRIRRLALTMSGREKIPERQG
jgi:hypothetical protein